MDPNRLHQPGPTMWHMSTCMHTSLHAYPCMPTCMHHIIHHIACLSYTMLIYSFQSVCIYKERERGRERERENAVDKCAAFTPHPKPPQTSGGPTRPRGFDSPSCPGKEERDKPFWLKCCAFVGGPVPPCIGGEASGGRRGVALRLCPRGICCHFASGNLIGVASHNRDGHVCRTTAVRETWCLQDLDL